MRYKLIGMLLKNGKIRTGNSSEEENSFIIHTKYISDMQSNTAYVKLFHNTDALADKSNAYSFMG